MGPSQGSPNCRETHVRMSGEPKSGDLKYQGEHMQLELQSQGEPTSCQGRVGHGGGQVRGAQIKGKPLKGVRLLNLENSILRYGLRGKIRTRPDILGVVLGPCAQCCPCEASEQKNKVQKLTSKLKEIEV